MKTVKITPSLIVSQARAFGVIDIENLAMGSSMIEPWICKSLANYLDQNFGHQPVMWVGATGSNAHRRHPYLNFDFPKARLLCRPGIDGADKCLAEVLMLEPASRRSSKVIIASGDGLLAPCAAQMKAEGCRIVVVGREGCIARGLLKIADEIFYFNPIATEFKPLNVKGGL